MIRSMTPEIPGETIDTAPQPVIFRNEPFIRYELCYEDTLSELAKEYHTSVAALCQINNIADPDCLMPGNFLLIPTQP